MLRVNPSQIECKVLQIVTRLNIGGPAPHAVLLTKGLAELGYQTTLVSGVCEAGEGDMSYLLNAEDRIRWVPEMSRSVRPLNNLVALFRLWRLIRAERPEVVHTHTAMAGCLGRLAALLAGVPVIIHTFHGNSLRGYFSPLANAVFLRLERWLARVTDGICVLSAQQLEELSAEFRVAPRARFHVVPLGMDLTPFTQMVVPKLDGGPLRVGWLGRLVPVKNVRLLLDVVEAARRRTDRIEFHVAGDGPERQAVMDAARRHGTRFVWHGWQRDIAPLIGQCHVLIQTSLNEGTPVALIQGMAAARPFVSTAAGGVVDMVTGPGRKEDTTAWYENGVLAEPGPEAFADALISLLEDPERIPAMGLCAREFAIARYQEVTLLSDLDSLYREALARKAPAIRPRQERFEGVS
jgi:glycosyltransferase involved in cell wall biosynthesis